MITVTARDGTDGFKILFNFCVCLHILIFKKLKFYNSLRGILSWCIYIYISNHHTVYFEYLIIVFVSYTSIKLGARGKFIKRERERKDGREGGRKEGREGGKIIFAATTTITLIGAPNDKSIINFVQVKLPVCILTCVHVWLTFWQHKTMGVQNFPSGE